jgi:hypothetical protein
MGALLRAGTAAVRRVTVLLVVLGLLAFNVASFTVAPIAEAMMDLTRRMALSPAVATEADLTAAQRRAADLETENHRLRTKVRGVERRAKQAETRAARLAKVNRTLARERQEVSARAMRLANRLDDAETSLARRLDQADTLTARIAHRSARNATRNIAAIPLESLPVAGALTIAGVTALEVSDAGRTISDMAALRSLAGIPPLDPGIVARTCSLVTPLPELPRNMTIAECRRHAGRPPERVSFQVSSEQAHKRLDEGRAVIGLLHKRHVPEHRILPVLAAVSRDDHEGDAALAQGDSDGRRRLAVEVHVQRSGIRPTGLQHGERAPDAGCRLQHLATLLFEERLEIERQKHLVLDDEDAPSGQASGVWVGHDDLSTQAPGNTTSATKPSGARRSSADPSSS